MKSFGLLLVTGNQTANPNDSNELDDDDDNDTKKNPTEPTSLCQFTNDAIAEERNDPAPDQLPPYAERLVLAELQSLMATCNYKHAMRGT